MEQSTVSEIERLMVSDTEQGAEALLAISQPAGQQSVQIAEYRSPRFGIGSSVLSPTFDTTIADFGMLDEISMNYLFNPNVSDFGTVDDSTIKHTYNPKVATFGMLDDLTIQHSFYPNMTVLYILNPNMGINDSSQQDYHDRVQAAP